MLDRKFFDADEMLEIALEKHKINLATLIAETAIWASPEVHKRLCQKGSSAWFPNTRRAKAGIEKRGNISAEGIKFDDNTYANFAIKYAIGINRKNLKNFAVCHIWDDTCYDERYHTAIANLVLIPRSIAGLTDHYEPVKSMLRYRAFELYGWYPESELPPKKPENYVGCWRVPEPDPALLNKSLRNKKVKDLNIKENEEIRKSLIEDRLSSWHQKKDSKVHRIIQLFLKNEGMGRDSFIELLEKKGISKNSYGAVSSLMTDKGNSYGTVFMVDERDRLFFCSDVRKHLSKIGWI